MEANEPLGPLLKMYKALQSYARLFEQVDGLMEKACDAIEECDVEVLSSTVVSMVEARMEYAREVVE